MVYSIFFFSLMRRRVYALTKDQYLERIQELIKIKSDCEISFTNGEKYFQCRCGKKKRCKCRKTDDGDDINSWATERHIIEFKLKDGNETFFEKYHLFIFQDDVEYNDAVNLINA